MKIQHLSDLHLEFQDMDIPATDADVVVLSGDIHTGIKGIEWASQFKQDVVYVLGNHEGYCITPLEQLLNDIRDEADKYPNVHFLENDTVTIGDTTFLGCTLWTDFQLNSNPPLSMHYARGAVNDFKAINFNDALCFTPEIAAELHRQSRTWLKDALLKSNSAKNIVVTHHLPTDLAIQDQFKGDQLSPAFASNCEDVFDLGKIDLWLYGHNHDCRQFRHKGILFSTNQRGYANFALVPDFDPFQIIQI